MKISTKLGIKLNNFSKRVAKFNEDLTAVSDSVKDLDKITAEGEASIKDAEKFTRRAVAKFNRTKTFCKNFADEAELIAEGAEDLANDQVAEAESVTVKTPEESDTVAVESQKFCRKMRIVAKRFSEVAENLNNITSEAESVVNMKPEDIVDTNPAKVATKAESTANGEGEVADGAEVTKQPNDVQTPAESVNFSLKNYYNFAVQSISKSFAEVVADSTDASDVVKDVSDEVTQEPEIPAETPENVETPPTTTTEKEVVNPAENNEEPKVAEFTDEELKVLDEGKKAIMEGNFNAAEELEKKLSDLESKTPDSGEKVLQELENFSKAFKYIKNFSSTNDSIYDQIKQFAVEACDSVVKKNIDADDLGSKAENLEKNQPGAGDLLTTVIECFGKIINAVKVPNATECPVTAPEFNPKNFCGDIEAFVDNIKVEDKRFARDVKAKCFALENAIEDENAEGIKDSTKDLAATLDKSDVAEIKEFGEKLVKFAEELAKSEEKAPEATSTEGAEVPAEVSSADSELNKVIDKIDEKGEQLKPEIATFTKKLCSAYKSMKCFTEEDLENKLQKVEELKKSVDEVPVNSTETPPETTSVTPAETNENQETPTLVEEPNKEDSELPSDSSLLNFSNKNKSADPFEHFASLDIH